MRMPTSLLFFAFVFTAGAEEPASDARMRELERKLDQATRLIAELNALVQSLRQDLSRTMDTPGRAGDPVAPERTDLPGQAPAEKAAAEFIRRLIQPEQGRDERSENLAARPEIFTQARYSAAPIRDAGSEFEPNFSLTRVETRWAGKVADRLGAALEIQFHPAIDGSPEELINDSYMEYYLSDHAAIRIGQFIKPFGFDIQQSSADRESPERGIFAGYFFPGQRDRGMMLFGNLGFLDNESFRTFHYAFGAFNGNRFFADNNRQPNFVGRIRKVFDRRNLALGLSFQLGKQLLPEGMSGNNDENLVGFDFQYVLGRLGLRGEYVAGNRPSTLLSIEPELAPAFRPGAHSAGGSLFASYRLGEKNSLYARYDQLNGDPVTGKNVRAFNFGYLWYVGGLSRIGVDYQLKNRPSFNDDAVNGKLNVTWGIDY